MGFLPFLAPAALGSQVGAATAVATAGGLGGTMSAMTPVIMAQGAAGMGLGSLVTAGMGGLGALQALGQSKYEATMADLSAGAESVKAKTSRNEGSQQALAIARSGNDEASEFMAHNAAFGGGGAGIGLGNITGTTRLNSSLATEGAEIRALGHEVRGSMYSGAAKHARSQGYKRAFGSLFDAGMKLEDRHGWVSNAVKKRKGRGKSSGGSSSGSKSYDLTGFGDYARTRAIARTELA